MDWEWFEEQVGVKRERKKRGRTDRVGKEAMK